MLEEGRGAAEAAETIAVVAVAVEVADSNDSSCSSESKGSNTTASTSAATAAQVEVTVRHSSGATSSHRNDGGGVEALLVVRQKPSAKA